MKIAVSSYSFSALMQSEEMTQLDCIAKAKELGFEGIEFTDLRPPHGMPEKEYAEQLREESLRCGLPVVNYAIGADFLEAYYRDGSAGAEIERVCRQADIAVLLGAPLMRHDASAGYPEGKRQWRGFDEAIPLLADSCRAVTQYAQTIGVKTMVENHGFFCQDSLRVEKLVNAVAHENFGWLVDMGNFLCADEEPAAAVSRASPYAFHVHAKDFMVKDGNGSNPGRGFGDSRGGQWLRGTVTGHGDVPVQRCLTILKQAGYNGYIGLEFEGIEPTEWALSASLENLRRYID